MTKKHFLSLTLFVLGMAPIVAQPFTQKDFEQLHAFRGAWTLTNKRGVLHEVWHVKAADHLTGVSFLVSGKDTIPQETLVLQLRNGNITYEPTFLFQNGGLPVVFTLISAENGLFIFENKAHDFPQRIGYQIPKDSLLNAYIEGPTPSGMKKIPFPYKRINRSNRVPSPEYTARKATALQAPSVFQKEIDGQLPGRLVYQDSLVTALYPLGGGQLPAHLLIIPNRTIPTLNDAKAEDAALLGHMILTARDLARQEGIEETGYRLAFNTNEDAGQSAFHLHLHLLGGARTGPMVDQRWRSIRRRLNDSNLTDPFEKRILGIWSGQGRAFGMPANISMAWEPDLQNNFLLLNYRMDMRDTSGRVQTFEGKAYYQPAGTPGKYKATWFDSGGEMHPVEATYDGQTLTANWGTTATKMGRTQYRFVDENMVEIADYIQAKDGSWKEFNRNTVIKNH